MEAYYCCFCICSWTLQQPSPRMLHLPQTTEYSEAAPWSHCSAPGCRSGSRSSTRNDVKRTSEGSFCRNPDKAADERVCEKGLAAGINTSAIYPSWTKPSEVARSCSAVYAAHRRGIKCKARGCSTCSFKYFASDEKSPLLIFSWNLFYYHIIHKQKKQNKGLDRYTAYLFPV